MMELSKILYKAGILETVGSMSVKIKGIAFDSREVKQDYIFVALKGTQVDGHLYIPQAISLGAKAVVCEQYPESLLEDATFVRVKDSNYALGCIASNFYQNPSSQIKLVGITGTNGKTTTATLLYELFLDLGYKVGLLSTIRNFIHDKEFKASHTTPDPIQINALLSDMVAKGISHCFMEVSSHAVSQERIAGLEFSGGVFTNLTRDHLDYHKTFKEYLAAKQRFFTLLPDHAFALSNQDDKNGSVMLQNTSAARSFYGLKSMADFKAKIIENQFSGLQLNLDGTEFWSPLIGTFNAYNLLAIYATAVLLGEEKTAVLTSLSKLHSVEGRFEYMLGPDQKIGIVDYAHTPDALENVLKTIRTVASEGEKVITLIGAGGDRDAGKRPLLAKIAMQYSDKVILTSDNPRNEDPAEILRQMEKGIEMCDKAKVLTIPDREEGIKTACLLSQAGDIILVAGKGHETYQEIKGVRSLFDDRVVLKKYLLNS